MVNWLNFKIERYTVGQNPAAHFYGYEIGDEESQMTSSSLHCVGKE